MIQSVLFTKKIDHKWLTDQLGSNILIDCCPTLRFDYTNEGEIKNKINRNCKQFIITSQNSVKAIKNLKIDGDFYVVGKKTASMLRKLNFNVVLETDYAKDLAPKLLKIESDKNWNFFCGNSRRDLLVDELVKNGNSVNEIITYQSIPVFYKVEQSYDAYVFFSPLSFQTFVKNNSVPVNSTIFTVGITTTSEVVKKYPNHNIITADIPLVDVVVNNIKHCINDKK